MKKIATPVQVPAKSTPKAKAKFKTSFVSPVNFAVTPAPAPSTELPQGFSASSVESIPVECPNQLILLVNESVSWRMDLHPRMIFNAAFGPYLKSISTTELAEAMLVLKDVERQVEADTSGRAAVVDALGIHRNAVVKSILCDDGNESSSAAYLYLWPWTRMSALPAQAHMEYDKGVYGLTMDAFLLAQHVSPRAVARVRGKKGGKVKAKLAVEKHDVELDEKIDVWRSFHNPFVALLEELTVGKTKKGFASLKFKFKANANSVDEDRNSDERCLDDVANFEAMNKESYALAALLGSQIVALQAKYL